MLQPLVQEYCCDVSRTIQTKTCQFAKRSGQAFLQQAVRASKERHVSVIDVTLGAALLRAGRLDAAEQVFRTSLARTPSNGWALRGLIEVYRKRGDTAAGRGLGKVFAPFARFRTIVIDTARYPCESARIGHETAR
jgi:Flp pilus assembly protein TadD